MLIESVYVVTVVTTCLVPSSAEFKSFGDVLCASGLDLQRLTGLSRSDVQQLLIAAAATVRRRPPITGQSAIG